MKIKYILPLFVILVSLFFLIKPSLSAWSSTVIFNATPDTVYLNWTNAYQSNVTVISNNTINITTISIYNSTNSFTWNYTQFNNFASCLNNTIYLVIRNDTAYSNTSGPINGSSTDTNNVSFIVVYDTNSSIHPCSPGRYLLRDLSVGNSTEQANINIILDIPLSGNSTNNPLSNSTGFGSFGPSLMPANATSYHSYFFNATSSSDSYIKNATSVLINLTGWPSSQDVDLFLFNSSGYLMAKSINKNTSEQIVYSYLPTSNQMWEIRVYGNSSNVSGITYYGQIIFNTLNVTNASDTDQRMDLLNFTSAFGSAMNATNVSTINISLKNEGYINLTNVVESHDLYHVQRFVSSGNRSIFIFVPNSTIASKLKVSLNWTGASNYSFDVYKPDGTLAMYSRNKHSFANITTSSEEEYNETTSIGDGGLWRVEITNNTNVTGTYTLTSMFYVDSSEWISSNFTAHNFNTTYSNYTVQYNLTVQNDTLDGKYEGYVQYRDNRGSILRVPIDVNVTTPSLMLNNSFQSSTVTLNENIGKNVTRTLNITYNNTGSFPITISAGSSANLSLSNKNISFTYSAPASIPAKSNGTINITIPINTSITGDTPGNYDGWISLNATDSHPSASFNLAIRLSLSSTLTVDFLGVKTYADTNTTRNSSAESVLFGFDVNYVGGSSLEEPLALNSSNITSIWLSNLNVSKTITLTNITNYTTTTPIYADF